MNRMLYSMAPLSVISLSILIGCGGLGVIEINQALAEAGDVTTGDTAGFPVTLSEAGSYILTGNLTVPNENTTGIEVAADNVTLDLNGYAILGPELSGSGSGVDGTGHINTTVVNGTVQGVGNDGIKLGDDSRVEKIRARLNGHDGIRVGKHSTMTGNTANENVNFGIWCAFSCTLTDNITSINGDDGILCGSGNILTGNNARFNGDDGINAGIFNLLTGNTAVGNSGDGISTNRGSLVTGNTASSNALFGLNLISTSFSAVGYANNVLSDNTAGQVSGGIQIGTNICDGDICP